MSPARRKLPLIPSPPSSISVLTPSRAPIFFSATDTSISSLPKASTRGECAGEEPVQSVADSIDLRDSLVDYKPEWYHDLREG